MNADDLTEVDLLYCKQIRANSGTCTEEERYNCMFIKIDIYTQQFCFYQMIRYLAI